MVSNNSIVQHTPSSAIDVHGSGPSLTLLHFFQWRIWNSELREHLQLECESTFQAVTRCSPIRDNRWSKIASRMNVSLTKYMT